MRDLLACAPAQPLSCCGGSALLKAERVELVLRLKRGLLVELTLEGRGGFGVQRAL